MASEFNKLKKDEVVEKADELKIELKSKETEIELMKTDFQRQMEEMKQMISNMAINQVTQQPAPQKMQKEPLYNITCYLLGKNSISLDKETTVEFDTCGTDEDLTYSELKSLIKFGKNKRLFSDGLLVLENQEDNSEFKVKPRRILTNEYIASVYLLDEKEFLEELKAITDNKSSSPAMHSFIYRSAYLYKKGEIKSISKDAMDIFKDYFGKGVADVYIDDDIL